MLGNYRAGRTEFKLCMQLVEGNCDRGLKANRKLKRFATDSFLDIDIRLLFQILTPAFLRKVVSERKVRLLFV